MRKFLAMVLHLLSLTTSAQSDPNFEKLLQLERARRFPYCGKLHLSQNVPDPVRHHETTTIGYRAIDAFQVEIVVYDTLGNIIMWFKNLAPDAGEVAIDTSQLSPGTYPYALIVNGRRIFRKNLIVLQTQNCILN